MAAFVRAKQADGSWTQWYDMDSLSYNNDDPNAVNGTEADLHRNHQRRAGFHQQCGPRLWFQPG